MISISSAKKLTGTYLRNYTDEEVQDLLNQMYGLAEIAVDKVILQGSNKTHGVIDLEKRKEHNGNNRG